MRQMVEDARVAVPLYDATIAIHAEAAVSLALA
jgi:aspartate/glutamate racemase